MKIINVTGMKPNAPGVIYCGRNTRNGWRASPLHNPFSLPRSASETERAACIDAFRVYFLKEIEGGNRPILEALNALTEDSVLGCWCKPKACHCDVIAEVWAKRIAEAQQAATTGAGAET